MRVYAVLPVLLILIFFIENANAQIVNIEDRRSTLADTSGWFGYLGLGVNLIKNNRSVTNIHGNLRAEHLKGKYRVLLLTDYNLIRADKESFIDNGFQHFRFNYKINKRLTYEFFSQIQFNNQVRIKLRGLVGTGLRVRILREGKQKVYWGLSYMREYNEIEIVEDVVTIFRDHRMSTYLSMTLYPFEENFSISNTTYYQPVLTDFSDVRLSSQTSLQFAISKRLVFSAIFSITNDTRVPENIPATYYSLKNGIRFNF